MPSGRVTVFDQTFVKSLRVRNALREGYVECIPKCLFKLKNIIYDFLHGHCDQEVGMSLKRKLLPGY